MVKFFKCEKCNYRFVSSGRDKPNMQCGAIIDWLVADNPDVGNDGFFQSEGLKPLGCGGKIAEITQEEAMSYEPGK